MTKIILLITFITLGLTTEGLAGPKVMKSDAPWFLSKFRKMVYTKPKEFFLWTERLCNSERIAASQKEPARVFEWQHRLALVMAASEFFNPDFPKIQGKDRKAAREFLESRLLLDPSLLVRDGAVESIRRIVQMQPGDTKSWQKILESAFLDSQNIKDNHGFFIRETILHTLREASLPLNPPIKKAALADKNHEVKELISLWSPKAFQKQTPIRAR